MTPLRHEGLKRRRSQLHDLQRRVAFQQNAKVHEPAVDAVDLLRKRLVLLFGLVVGADGGRQGPNAHVRGSVLVTKLHQTLEDDGLARLGVGDDGLDLHLDELAAPGVVFLLDAGQPGHVIDVGRAVRAVLANHAVLAGLEVQQRLLKRTKRRIEVERLKHGRELLDLAALDLLSNELQLSVGLGRLEFEFRDLRRQLLQFHTEHAVSAQQVGNGGFADEVVLGLSNAVSLVRQAGPLLAKLANLVLLAAVGDFDTSVPGRNRHRVDDVGQLRLVRARGRHLDQGTAGQRRDSDGVLEPQQHIVRTPLEPVGGADFLRSQGRLENRLAAGQIGVLGAQDVQEVLVEDVRRCRKDRSRLRPDFQVCLGTVYRRVHQPQHRRSDRRAQADQFRQDNQPFALPKNA